MVWEEIDYQEGARYLALNWDKDTCARSRLRRILPVRRGKRGSRPGMKGAGPRSKIHGDTEQWIFPQVKLSQEERKEIISEVIGIATKAMFENHFYNFGGKVFHQEQGGPIGLRGTCAVARIVMQLFDSKWKRVLAENGIRTWEVMRYVDDARAILPPVKPGWRWSQGRLRFCKRWRMEDMEIPGERRTKEILGQSMQGVESYLKFTMESGEDFQGGWLPTLDTTLRVEEDNSIMYRYYEKETTTNQTVQKSSAMEENCKIQILANDLVRRLGNTRDDGDSKEVSRVVDGYGQKLI